MSPSSGWRGDVERGRLTDEQFCRFVRRFSNKSVVGEVARVSSTRWSPDPSENDFRQLAPWALAEVARVALGYGNEYKSDATEDDIGWLCVAYSAIEDPMLRDHVPGSATKMMQRLSYAQFGYQQTQYNELARSIAVFKQTTPKADPPLKVLDKPDWQEKVLGCDLEDFVGSANVAVAGAMSTAGRLNTSWLEPAKFEGEDTDMDMQVAIDVLSDSYVTTVADFKATLGDRGRPHHSIQRSVSFNPLADKPIVAGLDDDWLIPVPALILRKASPLGIYYCGVNSARHGKAFADDFSTDVGNLFEQYVGRQLKLLNGVDLQPEIKYGKEECGSPRIVEGFLMRLPGRGPRCFRS